jgi:hypothetical protein
MMDFGLTEPGERDGGRGCPDAVAEAHHRIPPRVRDRRYRLGPSRGRGFDVVDEIGDIAVSARLDVGFASLRTGIHRDVHSGVGRSEQVHEGVGVAGDVGEYVPSGPPGQ